MGLHLGVPRSLCLGDLARAAVMGLGRGDSCSSTEVLNHRVPLHPWGQFQRPDAPDQFNWNRWGWDPGIRVFSVCLFMWLLHSVWSDWLMKTRLFRASLSQTKFSPFPPIFCDGQEGGSGLIGFAQVQGMEKVTSAPSCFSKNFSPLLPPRPHFQISWEGPVLTSGGLQCRLGEVSVLPLVPA